MLIYSEFQVSLKFNIMGLGIQCELYDYYNLLILDLYYICLKYDMVMLFDMGDQKYLLVFFLY